MVAEGAKRSPELIQLLELHTQFATITPYSQVGRAGYLKEYWFLCEYWSLRKHAYPNIWKISPPKTENF